MSRKNKSKKSDYQSVGKNKKRRAGGPAPAICTILGILIIAIVIVLCVPLVVPKVMGYEIYNVETGSMEPEIPVGSMVFVEPIDAASAVEGDVIAFNSGDTVVVHRVVENRSVEGSIVTKGDANPAEDVNPVAYSDVLGLVTQHYPYIGKIMVVYTTTVGKIYLFIFLACGILFEVLGSSMRARRRLQRKYEG